MMRKLFVPALLVLAAGLVHACGSDPSGPSEPRIEYGSAVAVGNGTARSYVISSDGKVSELGVALSEQAIEGLPGGTTPADGKSYLLPVPASNNTSYQLVELNWNPAGHPPPMVYTVPHFDIHFYTISLAERDAILPTSDDWAEKSSRPPPAGDRPAGYVADANPAGVIAGVPRMGVHWTDRGSHEFHGEAFTATFVLGSWDGEFTFLEPMVALDYLSTRPSFQEDVAVPGNFVPAKDRPEGYRVAWNAEAREYRIALTQMGGN